MPKRETSAENYILMMRHYPDLSSTSKPIRSTTQIWVVMRYQYRISARVSQMSFRVETSGGIAKCWLFSQAREIQMHTSFSLSAYTLYMHFQMHSIISFI